ncbi:MAG TPA: AAA family ATPase [Myxococcaceae bacterium]|nr:AAA family ATPase [Myxococcaceae bacterium]
MAKSQPEAPQVQPFLTRIAVRGFKAHYAKTELELRPLTILAGANSSGKSSAMQALLLLKQTIDALPLDVGPLKLGGPNVSFSDVKQFLAYEPAKGLAADFSITLDLSSAESVELHFRPNRQTVELVDCTYQGKNASVRLTKGLNPTSSVDALLKADNDPWKELLWTYSSAPPREETFEAQRFASFLVLPAKFIPSSVEAITAILQSFIHLSGHRGNPVRAYPRVVSGDKQPGLFHERVAGVLAEWTETKDPRVAQLDEALRRMGLTSRATTTVLDANSLEIKVARTLQPASAEDLVSVADVGFGVSQSLPVVVALIAANPGQLVYIEQPEIHLHPRAQKAIADLIADAARRGVRLVVETHSDIILSRLQWNIARKDQPLPPTDVIAHWFERDPLTGVSRVRSNTPDETGAFGDWPVDFADVAAEVDSEYSQAAFDRLPPDES